MYCDTNWPLQKQAVGDLKKEFCNIPSFFMYNIHTNKFNERIFCVSHLTNCFLSYRISKIRIVTPLMWCIWHYVKLDWSQLSIHYNTALHIAQCTWCRGRGGGITASLTAFALVSHSCFVFQQDQQNLPGVSHLPGTMRHKPLCKNGLAHFISCIYMTCIHVGIVPYSLYWLRPVYTVCISSWSCIMY